MSTTVHDLGLHVVEGGQIAVLSGRRIHGVHAPVFVAALVLEVDDMGVVLGPEVHPDAALSIVSNRLEFFAAGGASHRTDPDVQHAVFRGQVGKVFSVWGEARGYLLRVTEEDFARDQGYVGSVGHKFLSSISTSARSGFAFACQHFSLSALCFRSKSIARKRIRDSQQVNTSTSRTILGGSGRP